MTDVTPWPRTDEARALWRHILATPYDTIRRRLEMGERAEKADHMADKFVSTHGVTFDTRKNAEGWNALLDHIRGDR